MVETNPTSIHKDVHSILGLAWWTSIAMNCGVGHRHILDLVLPWLWYRPAAAAPVRPLAWEHPHAVGVALKCKKKKKQKTPKPKPKMLKGRQFSNSIIPLGSRFYFSNGWPSVGSLLPQAWVTAAKPLGNTAFTPAGRRTQNKTLLLAESIPLHQENKSFPWSHANRSLLTSLSP